MAKAKVKKRVVVLPKDALKVNKKSRILTGEGLRRSRLKSLRGK